MIKYSFGQDEEYVAVKGDEYEDLTESCVDVVRGLRRRNLSIMVLNDIMSGRDYINPNDDQQCEEECFDFMGPRISNIIVDDNEFNGGSIQEYTPTSEENTTMVPVLRIFDHFRNMRLNSLGSDYMSHADNWHCTKDQEIQTRSVENAAAITDEVSISNVDKRGCLHTVSTPRSIEGSFTRSAESPLITASPKETLHPNALHIMGHTASSSRMAPVNPAYLCIDVTDCIVRPKIITIPNNSPKNAYQNHVREEYSDTTDRIFLYNEVSAINECSTLGTQKTSQSRPLQTAMYKEPSSNRNVPRRPRNQGDTLSYIDLGDCDQYREPVVQILNVHLENMQHVNFHERDRLDIIVNMPDKKKTTLTKWATCEALGLLGNDKEVTIVAIESQPMSSIDPRTERTAHSRFKLLLDQTDESVCHAKKHSQLANLLVKTYLIIWDEAPMNDRRCFEALDSLLRDLMNALEIVLEENSCLGRRLLANPTSNEERERSEVFAKWLLNVGNGEIGEPDQENDEDTSWIIISQEYFLTLSKQGLSELIDFIYDDTTLKAPTASVTKTYLSRDEAILIGRETSETEMLYPMEYLNTITFPGFAPQELQLKVGSPIMMLRNVNMSGGLCNGTRMIVTSLMSKLIEA
ncbi:DNA helicase [Tanacetum coccineum]